MSLRRLLPLLALVLVVATLGLVAHSLHAAVRLERQASASLALLAPLTKALETAEMVSREHGPTDGLLSETRPPRAEPGAQRSAELLQARARTDRAWAELQRQFPQDGDHDPALMTAAAEQSRRAQRALGEARVEVDRVAALPAEQRTPEALRHAVQRMADVAPLLTPVMDVLASQVEETLPTIADVVQGARRTAELHEYAGLLGSDFTPALMRQQPFQVVERQSVEYTRRRIAELRLMLQLSLQRSSASPEARAAWAALEQRYFGQAWPVAERVIRSGESDGRFDIGPAAFAAAYAPHMNAMFDLRDALLQQARARAVDDRMRARFSLGGVIVVSLLLAGALAAALVLVNQRLLRPLLATARRLQLLAQSQAAIGWPHGRKTAPVDSPLVLTGRDEMEIVAGAMQAFERQTARRVELEHERDALIERLRLQSDTDFLTGLPNRRAFVAAATQSLTMAKRNGLNAAVLLFDVDHFKLFNDRHGHAAGDAALVTLAQVMKREVRGGDLMDRHGGEEFALLLMGCEPDNACFFAERLRRAVAAQPVPPPAAPGSTITISIGIADTSHHGYELGPLLSLADAAMYRAKATGRNRVVVADGPLKAGADVQAPAALGAGDAPAAGAAGAPSAVDGGCGSGCDGG
jgi:diguanylate cyclase (GGDEF)-like protein